jgi:hypothetical protein
MTAQQAGWHEAAFWSSGQIAPSPCGGIFSAENGEKRMTSDKKELEMDRGKS